MVDIVDKRTRGRMMSGIRSANTKPEMAVRKALYSEGFRYRLHHSRLPGKPDIVLASLKSVVLVHGCFWHRHPGCKYAYSPRSNVSFWTKKFRSNVERDKLVQGLLRQAGWRVHVVWECQTKAFDSKKLVEELRRRRHGRKSIKKKSGQYPVRPQTSFDPVRTLLSRR